jgi:glycosyltransferase involved in cell wall biosynthesis
MISNPEYREDQSIYGYKVVADSFRNIVPLGESHHVIHFCPPHNISPLSRYFKADKRAVLTMFESENIHKDWVRAINTHVDLLLVPNTFNKRIFSQAGVTKPIEIVSLPTQASYFQFRERFISDKIKILHYNAGEPRKGYNEVIKAWVKYFGNRDDVQLIIKNNTRSRQENLNKPFFELNTHPGKYKNIRKLVLPYTDTEMVELLHECHLLLYPSRGEGWGYTPREAMATGLPCILTDKHSFEELPNDIYLPVKSSLEFDFDPIPFWYFETWRPSVEDIARQIQYAIDNYSEMKSKAVKAYEYVDKECRASDDIIKILRSYEFEV